MTPHTSHLTPHRFFTIPEVLEATQGRLIQRGLHQVVGGISIDSRTLKPGEMFVALKGERFDGHAFLSQALKREASGAVIEIVSHRIPETSEEEQLRRGKAIIGVKDTRSALQGLAQFHRRRFSIPVVAVTGSNGKTTTKEMIAAILAQDHEVLSSEGNKNNQIGVPLTLLRLSSRHQAAVVEMGISQIGEMRTLAQVAQPQVGVITNIGPTHLEALGSIEGVAQAKGELLEALPLEKGVAILNRDDPFFEFLGRKVSCRRVTFGLSPGTHVRGMDLAITEGSATTFRLVVQSEVMGLVPGLRHRPSDPPVGRTGPITDIKIRLPMLGTHNVANAIAASAAAAVLGCGLDQIKQALEAFQPPAMRSELLRGYGAIILNDAYNANPASMEAALLVLNQFETDGERIAVLGDMLELGTAEHQAHREVGERMAQIPAGRLMAVGPRARLIAEGALSSGMSRERVTICQTTGEAAEILKRLAKRGDVILLKGSRGMHLEEIIEGLLRE